MLTDNQDAIVPNQLNTTASWVAGDVSGRTSATDVTNTALIAASLLYQYDRSVDNYRCPSDKVNITGYAGAFRARSYSLNCMMGYNVGVIDDHSWYYPESQTGFCNQSRPIGYLIFCR